MVKLNRMIAEWFQPVAEQLKSRVTSDTKRIEFVTGIRINAVPHIGTYLTLASTFVYASSASEALQRPATVHVHFLDNDPALSNGNGTHFHCVFQKRSTAATSQFLNENYFAYLKQLASVSGVPFTHETYSLSQLNSDFRSVVIKSLPHWKDFKYYVSGPPLVGSPSGVRGIGSPCPQCGLFEGWTRPEVDVDSENRVVLEARCCDHGSYSSVLTPSNETFINLETTFRNVIKEILASQKPDVLSVMIKGQDWQEGIRNIDSVLQILKVNKIPLRFLLPVVKTKNGTKLSKSAIQKCSNDFQAVPAFLLDMIEFRNKFSNYSEVLFDLSKRNLATSAFLERPIYPDDLLMDLER